MNTTRDTGDCGGFESGKATCGSWLRDFSIESRKFERQLMSPERVPGAVDQTVSSVEGCSTGTKLRTQCSVHPHPAIVTTSDI